MLHICTKLSVVIFMTSHFSQMLLKLRDGCSHNIVIKDLCAECGKDLRIERCAFNQTHVFSALINWMD